jgi:hypothetical protein
MMRADLQMWCDYYDGGYEKVLEIETAFFGESDLGYCGYCAIRTELGASASDCRWEWRHMFVVLWIWDV